MERNSIPQRCNLAWRDYCVELVRVRPLVLLPYGRDALNKFCSYGEGCNEAPVLTDGYGFHGCEKHARDVAFAAHLRLTELDISGFHRNPASAEVV